MGVGADAPSSIFVLQKKSVLLSVRAFQSRSDCITQGKIYLFKLPYYLQIDSEA
jgi:hypothetical protein